MSANTPAPTAVSGQSDPAFILDATLDTPLPATTGADNRAADPSSATPSPRPEPVTTQIAHRILSMPAMTERDAPLELTLDPPELGQIRISVTRGTDGMILHLHADQPETLDLLRRHGGALMQELQRQGLDHAGYSFSGRDQGGQQQKPGAAPVITAEDSAQTHPTRTPHPTQSAAGTSGQSGLDIRL
jgi:flagellar hook-length control protein FliK